MINRWILCHPDYIEECKGKKKNAATYKSEKQKSLIRMHTLKMPAINIHFLVVAGLIPAHIFMLILKNTVYITIAKIYTVKFFLFLKYISLSNIFKGLYKISNA